MQQCRSKRVVCVSYFISRGFGLHPLGAYLGVSRENTSAENYQRLSLVPTILHSDSLQKPCTAKSPPGESKPPAQRNSGATKQRRKRHQPERASGLLVSQRAALRRDYVPADPTIEVAEVIEPLRVPIPKVVEPSRARPSTHHH